MNGIAIGIGLLIIMAGVAMGFAKSPMTTNCTASPYKSVVFTGKVTDATTGVGVASAVVIWSDPPYSNSQTGTQTDSNGNYYKLAVPPIPFFRGCDSVEVVAYKVGSNYLGIDQTFQLPDNACIPVNSTCNSVTIGANYALVPSTPLVAAFTYSATGLIVTFTDKSTGSPTGWTWTFGDGQNSYSQSPTHTYSNGGTFNVTLLVGRSIPSASSTVSKLITVALGQNNQGTTPPPSCPTGYTGTYPNCIPPASTTTTNTTTNKTVNQPANLNAYNVTPLQILVLFVGVALVAVGVAWKSGRRN